MPSALTASRTRSRSLCLSSASFNIIWPLHPHSSSNFGYQFTFSSSTERCVPIQVLWMLFRSFCSSRSRVLKVKRLYSMVFQWEIEGEEQRTPEFTLNRPIFKLFIWKIKSLQIKKRKIAKIAKIAIVFRIPFRHSVRALGRALQV